MFQKDYYIIAPFSIAALVLPFMQTQSDMTGILSSVFIIGACVAGVVRYLSGVGAKAKILSVCAVLIIAGWLIALAGTHAASVFGNYSYTCLLQPAVFGVPLAIGLIRLFTLIAGRAMVQRFERSDRPSLVAFPTALIITAFDFLLEPVAVENDLWVWEGATVPFRNFLVWFAAGYLFSYVSEKLKIFNQKIDVILIYIYLILIIYFILVKIF